VWQINLSETRHTNDLGSNDKLSLQLFNVLIKNMLLNLDHESQSKFPNLNISLISDQKHKENTLAEDQLILDNSKISLYQNQN